MKQEKQSSKAEIEAEFDRISSQSRLDAMLDKPVRNPRYGGMTMREMVRKVVLRRDDQADERKKIGLK